MCYQEGTASHAPSPQKIFRIRWYFSGAVCELSEPKKKAIYAPHQFCTRDVYRRFCGGGAWISGSHICPPRILLRTAISGAGSLKLPDRQMNWVSSSGITCFYSWEEGTKSQPHKVSSQNWLVHDGFEHVALSYLPQHLCASLLQAKNCWALRLHLKLDLNLTAELWARCPETRQDAPYVIHVGNAGSTWIPSLVACRCRECVSSFLVLLRFDGQPASVRGTNAPVWGTDGSVTGTGPFNCTKPLLLEVWFWLQNKG